MMINYLRQWWILKLVIISWWRILRLRMMVFLIGYWRSIARWILERSIVTNIYVSVDLLFDETSSPQPVVTAFFLLLHRVVWFVYRLYWLYVVELFYATDFGMNNSTWCIGYWLFWFFMHAHAEASRLCMLVYVLVVSTTNSDLSPNCMFMHG